MNTEEIRAMILQDLKLQGLPREAQDRIIDKFTENTMKRVTLAILERLPEDARAEFVRLGEAKDSEGILKLFQANIPDLDTLIRSEVQEEIALFNKSKPAA